MRPTAAINLASEPFRRDRPLIVASVALAVVLFLLLGMQIFLIVAESGEGTEIVAAIGESRGELRELQAERAKLSAVLDEPENAVVLERSLFLNALLLRKGISWTLIFDDLEEVLPYDVKLIQVRPQVSQNPDDPMDNLILLEMVVASRAPEPVIGFLRALEGSDLFGETAVASMLPPTDSEPLYRYQLSVRYDRDL